MYYRQLCPMCRCGSPSRDWSGQPAGGEAAGAPPRAASHREVARARARRRESERHENKRAYGYRETHLRGGCLGKPASQDQRAGRGANTARNQATEVDEALNGGVPAFHTAMAKQGVMHGIAVGGCCELSTSAHHLIARIGEEQGYRLAESSGMDIEEHSITIATRLLKGRAIAKQVWRDYHRPFCD